jgi:hypothetical protein
MFLWGDDSAREISGYARARGGEGPDDGRITCWSRLAGGSPESVTCGLCPCPFLEPANALSGLSELRPTLLSRNRGGGQQVRIAHSYGTADLEAGANLRIGCGDVVPGRAVRA